MDRTTRSVSLDLLDVPKSRTESFGDRSFSVAAPILWNSLPLYIREAESLAGFKKALKTHFLGMPSFNDLLWLEYKVV